MRASSDFLFALLHRNVIHPLWTAKDGDYPYRHLRLLEKSQYARRESLDALRLARLRALVSHAFEKCPYYRKSFADAGVGPADIKTLADIARFPRIAKRDIQEHREEMRRSDRSPEQLILNRTGGSTGEPLLFYLDAERMRSRKAATIRHDRWAGKDVFTLYASVWGHAGKQEGLKTALVDRYVRRFFYLDASAVNDASLAAFMDQVRRLAPEVFLGYANALLLLARHLESAGITDFPRPRAVISSAEVLTPESRATISRVLGCPVFDRYGCRETSVIASECPAHDGLHINEENLLVEVLDANGKPAPPGRPGEIVITDLMNLAMPLIRYRIRDMGELLPGPCPCGRTLSRMKISGGRVTDFLRLPDGRMVSGASLTINLVANIPGVRQAQILQPDPDRVVLRLVRGEEFSDATVQKIKSEARKLLGESAAIGLDFVDRIEPLASGKHPFSISCFSKSDL
ncbi:MAG: AMP-binding protein [Thermodesulfobacteriota bacterium]